jgi:preprotein translocase subunit YajC
MTGQLADWTFWLIMIVALLVFLVLPQYMSRRRQKQREADLKVGDTVVTIGGFIGELTMLDLEQNIAKVKLADGVELRILPGAINGRRQEATDEENAEPAQSDEG